MIVTMEERHSPLKSQLSYTRTVRTPEQIEASRYSAMNIE
jgi:hypothetical protein